MFILTTSTSSWPARGIFSCSSFNFLSMILSTIYNFSILQGLLAKSYLQDRFLSSNYKCNYHALKSDGDIRITIFRFTLVTITLCYAPPPQLSNNSLGTDVSSEYKTLNILYRQVVCVTVHKGVKNGKLLVANYLAPPLFGGNFSQLKSCSMN